MMALSAFVVAAALAGDPGFPAPDCTLVAGWTGKGPVRTFEPDTLFDYMDGNAEGYFAYGFALMKGVTCVNEAGDQLVIDVSELRDADHAWGIFAAHRDTRSPNHPIGAASQVLPRRATFARGRYYVEIAASPAGDHSEALGAFATALEAQTPGRTTVPEALSWFPKEGLETDSARLVPQSVLGIRSLRRGFVARYPEGRAFMVLEETAEAAADTLEKVRERYPASAAVEAVGDAAFAATDDYLDGMVVFRKGAVVAGVANLSRGADGTPLARRLADALP
jgi:hypothetical protein